MIRRSFWLTVGAAGGIMGYRRAVSVGRSVSGRLESGPRTRKVKRGLIRQAIRFGRDARGFTRDVREGMEIYRLAHSEPSGSTLSEDRTEDRTRAASRSRAVTRTRAANRELAHNHDARTEDGH